MSDNKGSERSGEEVTKGLPDVQASDVLAITLSDTHFSDKVPIAKSCEDWYNVMERYINQLKAMVGKYKCPILFAGDLFDKWNQPPKLINWLLWRLPLIHGIPGQHDLPYHRYSDITHSAFWTMCIAGTIKLLEPDRPLYLKEHNICIYGFPWGTEVTPPIEVPKGRINIALIHSYIWKNHLTSYPGAPKEAHVQSWNDKLKGYHFAVFGDNHKGFVTHLDYPITIVNNGAFIRRKVDEIDYAPFVTLLMKSGAVQKVYLDTEQDRFSVGHIEVKDGVKFDAEAIIEEFGNFQDATLNFEEAIKRYLNDEKVGPSVREIILKAMGG